MSKIPQPRFTRTLTATAVAALMTLSLGTGYAACPGDSAAQPAAAIPSAPAGQPAPQAAQAQPTDQVQQAAQAQPSDQVQQAAQAQPAPQAKPAQQAQDEQLTERETVAEYPGWEEPGMGRVAVHGGRALLHHIQAAHEALEQNRLGEARSGLDAAEDFAQGLQLMVPYTVVKDNVRNADHELVSSRAGIIVGDMLPIYSSLDEMSEFAPELAKTTKSKLDEAAQQADKGKQEQAVTKVDEVAEDVSATTVYLPVLYVEHQIEAARNALSQDPADTATAKTAIDDAQQSLVQATVNMHIFPGAQTAAKGAPASPQVDTGKAG